MTALIIIWAILTTVFTFTLRRVFLVWRARRAAHSCQRRHAVAMTAYVRGGDDAALQLVQSRLDEWRDAIDEWGRAVNAAPWRWTP